MSSDADYMSFLDKANQPVGGPAPQATADLKTLDAGGGGVPAPIAAAVRGAFYSSDADEPFVPVALRWDGSLPDEEQLARLVQHPEPARAEVEILDPVDWDSRGSYRDVVEAVRRAGKGNDVRVYRIARGAARAEYWVLTTEGGRLLGAKALAVES